MLAQYARLKFGDELPVPRAIVVDLMPGIPKAVVDQLAEGGVLGRKESRQVIPGAGPCNARQGQRGQGLFGGGRHRVVRERIAWGVVHALTHAGIPIPTVTAT